MPSWTIPPNFDEHVVKGGAPRIYYIFWPIGGISLIITCLLIIPRWIKIYKYANNLRNNVYNNIFLPRGYLLVLLILLYPIILSFSEYLILYFPNFMYSLDFLGRCYEGLSVYLFSEYLIMLLGSDKKLSLINNIRLGPPVKYFTVLPFFCCFKCFEKKKYLSVNHFWFIYILIIQYTLLAPFWSFVRLLRATRGEEREHKIHWTTILNTISALICIYGLFIIFKVSSHVLNYINIRGKCICIKLILLSQLLPVNFLMYTNNSIINHDYKNYSKQVIIEAYGSTVTLILTAIISYFFFYKYYNLIDCEIAQKSNENLKPFNDKTIKSIEFNNNTKINKQYIVMSDISSNNNSNNISDELL